MKWVIAVFMAVIAIMGIVIICIDLTGRSNINIPPPPEMVYTTDVPDKEIIDVYFDASVSMAGYTTLEANNIYRELPDELASIGGSMGEINFYRFGENIYPIGGIDYREYNSPSVYTELSNSIKNVVAQANPEHLTIILSDLFETDTAWSAVAQNVKDKYFTNRKSVAVIGMKNPFNGRIYDVGLNKQAFDYNSGNDTSKYRPFYMMVMGPEVLVNDFLRRTMEQNWGHEFRHVKLSSILMAEPRSIYNTESIEVNNIYSDDSLNLPENSKAVQYSLNSMDDEILFTHRFVYEMDPLGCEMDMSKVIPNIVLYSLNIPEEDSEMPTWEVCDVSKVSASIIPVEGMENTYDATVRFMPRDVMKAGTVNYININIAPTYDGFILPNWIKEWNMPNMVTGDPSQFSGSKTVNLMRTVGSLKDSVLKAGKPSIVNMEIYFNMLNME